MDTAKFNTVPDKAPPLALEFRLASARHPELPDQTFWMMELVGKVGGIGHCIRSKPMPEYPAHRQIAAFFSRTRRDMRDWFDGPDYQAAKDRAKKPSLLVIPGRY